MIAPGCLVCGALECTATGHNGEVSGVPMRAGGRLGVNDVFFAPSGFAEEAFVHANTGGLLPLQSSAWPAGDPCARVDEQCPRCLGRGEVFRRWSLGVHGGEHFTTPFGAMSPCPWCAGSGCNVRVHEVIDLAAAVLSWRWGDAVFVRRATYGHESVRPDKPTGITAAEDAVSAAQWGQLNGHQLNELVRAFQTMMTEVVSQCGSAESR